jgi:hypothetical protein
MSDMEILDEIAWAEGLVSTNTLWRERYEGEQVKSASSLCICLLCSYDFLGMPWSAAVSATMACLVEELNC